MKKLTLDVEELMVETFEPSRTERGDRGTIRAHEWSRLGHDETCGGISCDYACITVYDDSCNNICAA